MRRQRPDLPEQEHGTRERIPAEALRSMRLQMDDDRAAGGVYQGNRPPPGGDRQRREKEDCEVK